MEIEELSNLADLGELVQLFLDVWGTTGDPPLNTDTLRAMAHSGSYIAGARAGGRLAGGAIGWLGRAPSGEPILHSHILGVRSGAETRGLGFAIKQHQRAWCLERGVRTIEWTFDPLVRRNAYFNLGKLGGDAAEYLVDFYGAMSDGINAGDESDRILVRWNLESAKAVAAAAGNPSFVEARDSPALLRVADRGEPVASAVVPPATCEVPQDIVAIRRSDPDLALRWRRALRATLGAHLLGGGTVAGVARDGLYVLASAR